MCDYPHFTTEEMKASRVKQKINMETENMKTINY